MSKGHLTHSVFFSLKEPTEPNIQQFVEDCYEYLSDADGVVSLHAGARILDLDRELNDDQFHVALIVIFESRAAHNAYQEMDKHQTFLKRNKDTWAAVRVFDATS